MQHLQMTDVSIQVQNQIADILDNNYTTIERNGCVKYENNAFEIIISANNHHSQHAKQSKQHPTIVVTDKRHSPKVVYKDIDTAYSKIKGISSTH